MKMRFKIVLMSLLLTGSAFAHPRSEKQPVPQAPVLLDLGKLHLFHAPEAPDPSNSAAAQPKQEDWSVQRPLPSLSVGTLHATFGRDDDPWANLQSYNSQLGGSAWQDQESRSRSAKLLFVWPTDK
ncbi:MAG TPA: hypothetical protein VGK90_12425 [Rhizomicrobium sp.]|jgi:hypothetical protein